MTRGNVQHLRALPLLEVLITRVQGSAPVQIGDHMLYDETGQWHGTVGGGALEWSLMQRTAHTRQTYEQVLGPGSDQCCGGRVRADIVSLPGTLSHCMTDHYTRLYRRTDDSLHLLGAWDRHGDWHGNQPPPPGLHSDSRDGEYGDSYFVRARRLRTPLWLYGAGHVARALASIAAPLDYALHIVDARPPWADTAAFPPHTRLYREDGLALAPPPPDAVALIMTHSHNLDYALLTRLCRYPMHYLGVIGSRSKAARFRHALNRDGHSTTDVHMPIGLPGMGKRPAEVAVSILAELLQRRHAR